MRRSSVYCTQWLRLRESRGRYRARASIERERAASTNGRAATSSHTAGSARDMEWSFRSAQQPAGRERATSTSTLAASSSQSAGSA
jgi:hypothetical protein